MYRDMTPFKGIAKACLVKNMGDLNKQHTPERCTLTLCNVYGFIVFIETLYNIYLDH